MATATIRANQNLADYALQHYGDAAVGIVDIIRRNELDYTDLYQAAGTKLTIPDDLTAVAGAKPDIVQTLRRQGKVPATGELTGTGIGYMIIETDFIVS